MTSKNTSGKGGPDLMALMGSGPDLSALTKRVDIGDGPDMSALLAGPQEPLADPLAATEYTGDLEKDAAAELTELERAYRDRAKNEAGRFKAATDSEYWVAVCFKSRAEKEKWLAEFGLDALGDKYIDGNKAGQRLRRR